MAAMKKQRLRKIALRLLLLTLGVLAGMALAEMALRILGLPEIHRPPTRPDQFTFVQMNRRYLTYTNLRDESFRFTYDSDPRGYFGPDCSVEHTTNSRGFRGQLLTSLPKRAGDFRIVFLGDSFTFGEGVHDADTYAQKTQEILNAKETASARHVECYNLGVGGYNVGNCELVLRQYVAYRGCDCVILKLDISDMEPPLFVYEQDGDKVHFKQSPRWFQYEGSAFIEEPPEGGIQHLHTVQLVWKAINTWRRNRAFLDYYRNLPHTEDWQKGLAALESIGQHCRDREVPLYVLLFPLPPSNYAHYPLQAERAVLKAAAAKQGTVIDLLPLLAQWDPRDTWVHPTDYHPNEKIHALAAEQIAEAILRDGILQKPQ